MFPITYMVFRQSSCLCVFILRNAWGTCVLDLAGRQNACAIVAAEKGCEIDAED